MVTAVSTIANGGAHVTPRVVKQIVYKNKGEVKDIEIKKEEGVISEKTSKDVLSMMKSVVQEGTGKNAKVEGYSIGGKTGTSEDGVNTGKYVTSFIGTAPIENPEVVVLITLYNPTGEGGHQGGGVAAPVAGGAAGAAAEEKSAFNVVLKDVGSNKIQVIKVVRDITGLGLKEAKDLVDGAPKTVKENVAKEEAEEMKSKFAEAGATVELQ